MPYHSSKNFHRAQQQELDKLEETYWTEFENYGTLRFNSHIPWYCHANDTRYHSECPSDCQCRDYSWDRAFSAKWVKRVGKKSDVQCLCCFKEDCRYRGCSCDLCYDLIKLKWKHDVVEKYFSTDEILAVDAPSDPRVFVPKVDYKNILSGKYQTEGVDVPKINIYRVKLSTIEVFWKILQEELLKQHQQKELEERVALLAKYGLTLEDHEKAKEERRLYKEEMRKSIGGNSPSEKIDGQTPQ